MNVLCNACLCAGRNLYPIAGTGIEELYLQILNEIRDSDIICQMEIRVCWECRRILQNFKHFQLQARKSHQELVRWSDASTILALSKPPRLKLHIAYKLSMPLAIKPETNSPSKGLVHSLATPKEEEERMLANNLSPSKESEYNLVTASSLNPTELMDDVVKMEPEEHCEPQAMAYELEIDAYHKKRSLQNFNKDSTDFYDDDIPLHDSDDEVLAKRVRKNREEEKKRCPQCEVEFDNAKELRGHVRKTHSKSKKSKLKSILKQKTIKDIDNLESSIDNEEAEHNFEETNNDNEGIHNDNGVGVKKVYKCDFCDDKFDKLKEMKAHVISEHPEKNAILKAEMQTKDGKPHCAECKKTFSSKKTYRYHLNVVHLGHNRHACPRCDNVYQWKSNLARHLRTHRARDSDELYCAACDKRFASVATHRQHLKLSRRHVGEHQYSFKCDQCDKKFVSKVGLRDHVDWEHLQHVKFRCQLCLKAFKSHTSLYIHKQNVHRDRDKKDNLCHVCGKSYQNAAKLKYHIIAMHTLETPHRCAACPAAFGWYSSLYRHVREVHYKMKMQPNRRKKGKKGTDTPAQTLQPPAQISH